MSTVGDPRILNRPVQATPTPSPAATSAIAATRRVHRRRGMVVATSLETVSVMPQRCTGLVLGGRAKGPHSRLRWRRPLNCDVTCGTVLASRRWSSSQLTRFTGLQSVLVPSTDYTKLGYRAKRRVHAADTSIMRTVCGLPLKQRKLRPQSTLFQTNCPECVAAIRMVRAAEVAQGHHEVVPEQRED